MGSARDDYFDRMAAFVRATQEPILQVRPPADVDHNARARLLRNGLAVVGFALLEDFVKRRTGEVLRAVSLPSLRFSDLPLAIQEAATVGAMASVWFQAKVRRSSGQDHIAFVQEVAGDVASTRTSAFRLSEIAFGYAQSNLGHEDVKKILGAFGVSASWDDVRTIAKRVGLGGTASYGQIFQSAARMRHEAAHNGAADTATADLTAFAQNATAIAIAFDVLVSRCVRLMRDKDSAHLTGAKKVTAADVSFRFVDPTPDGGWREWVEGATRAVRKGTDGSILMVEAIARAKAKRQLVVLRASDLTPARWFPTDEA